MFNSIKRNQAQVKGCAPNLANKRRGRLRLEALESRRMLAGDVGVEVVDGNLLIRGDRLDNAIEVSQGQDGTDRFVIRGLISEDGVQTTVNGQELIRVDGVTGNVIADMRAGDDVIYIHDADLPGNLLIRTELGNDTVLIGGLPRDDAPTPTPLPTDRADTALAIDSVEVGDPVEVDPVPILPRSNVTIAGSAFIATANGKDRIGIGSVDVAGDLSINTGRHEDHLTLGLNELPGPANDTAVRIIDGPPGISLPLNVRGSLSLNTGSGDDVAWMEALHIGGNMNANLGAGDDVLSVNRGDVAGHVAIQGSLGNDLIGLAHLVADQIAIRAGRGDDGVGLADVKASRIGVGLGEGNDQMRVANSKARVARFHGGPGVDSLEFQGENELHDLAILGFETIS